MRFDIGGPGGIALCCYHLVNMLIVLGCASAVFAWSNEIGDKITVHTSFMNQVADDWK